MIVLKTPTLMQNALLEKCGAILKKRTGVEEQCGKMQCPTNPISEKEKESQIEKDKNTSDHNSTTTTNDNQKSSTTTKAVKRKSDEINSSATCTQITKKKKISIFMIFHFQNE
ncbi:hypothetical protein Avbf_13364 [Armadillidium vulgare]|nr:hypothetical protein Avbf_13364 [Armadillidium vulgare]